MMKSWIPWSLLALLSWGFWGLFPKLATNYISPRSAILYESLGAALAGLVALLSIGAPREANSRGVLFGVLTGLCAFTGQERIETAGLGSQPELHLVFGRK